jgi:hypothetical protein
VNTFANRASALGYLAECGAACRRLNTPGGNADLRTRLWPTRLWEGKHLAGVGLDHLAERGAVRVCTARPKAVSVVSSTRFISGVSGAGTYQLSASERTWSLQMRRTLR